MKMGTLTDQKPKKKKREKTIKKAGIKIIRINPDKEDFDIFDGISEMDFIYHSCEKLTKQLNTKTWLSLLKN